MYSNRVLCRQCTDCIFYYCFGGLKCYCGSFLPAIPLRWVSALEYDSNPSLASAYDLRCDHYINSIDHLIDLRFLLDSGAI